MRTIRRLETNEHDDPGVRLLNNCAIVLGVSIAELIEEEWLEWQVFNRYTAAAPPGRT